MDETFAKNFNKIFVIESLDDSDRKTGEELYDDIISRLSRFGDGSFESKFCLIENKTEFANLMSDIAIEASRGVNPILHFEIHGSQLGIVLKNGDLIPFPILSTQLSLINSACKNNLFLTLAICHGGMIAFNVSLASPAPFLGFIGSYDEVSDIEILHRYTDFYQEFLVSRNFEVAFDLFKKSNGIENKKFHLIDTYELFVKVYKKYIGENLNPSKLKLRATLALKSVKTINRKDRRKKEKDFIKVVKNTRQKYYKEHSRKFFMIDLYPENKDRFEMPDNYKDL